MKTTTLMVAGLLALMACGGKDAPTFEEAYVQRPLCSNGSTPHAAFSSADCCEKGALPIWPEGQEIPGLPQCGIHVLGCGNPSDFAFRFVPDADGQWSWVPESSIQHCAN